MHAKNEVRRSLCCFCSALACGFLIEIQDNRPVQIKPNPDVVLHGQQCFKWQMMAEYYYHKDRLNFPLKRVGSRGEGKYEKITWDKALDEVASKLNEIREKYGAETVATLAGTAHTQDYTWPRMRFMNLFGSPNYVGNESVCYAGRFLMDGVVWGQVFPIHIGLRDGHRCIVIAVQNPVESWPPIWSILLQAKKRGCKLIHIDPRFTEVSRNADLWLQVRPGSDGAWLLAWIRAIIEEKWYDKEFIQYFTNATFLIRGDTNKLLRESDIDRNGHFKNFVVWDSSTKRPAIWISEDRKYNPETARPSLEGSYEIKTVDGSTILCKTVWNLLKEYVEPWTFEKAEEITWVSAEKLRQACEWYANLKPSTLLGEYVWEANNPYAILSRAILRVLTGNLGKGDILVPPIPFDMFVGNYQLEFNESLPLGQVKKRIGYDRFRLLCGQGYERISELQRKVFGGCATLPWAAQAHAPLVWRAILSGKPYPIKALLISGCGALTKFNNTRLVYEVMKKVELITVLDMFHNPNTMMADYVFPACHWMEKPNLHTFEGNYDFILAAEQALPPLYERLTDFDFWKGLGVRLGQGEHWPWKSLQENCDWRLRSLGFNSMEEFMNRKKGSYYMNLPPRYEEKGFATPSGKVEIYPSILEDLGLPVLPMHVEPPESPYSTPMLAKQYPLICIIGMRIQPFTHSEHRQIESRRRMHPDPIVQIHPDVARNLDPPVADGDWVWIESPRGRIKQRAKITEQVHPRVICVQHNWWFPEKSGSSPSLFGLWESSINVITDDDPDKCGPVTGNWPNKAMLSRVYKA